MASSIDATKPTAGAALTADVRNNFSAAKTEIEALQAAVASALVAKAGDRYIDRAHQLGYANHCQPAPLTSVVKQRHRHRHHDSASSSSLPVRNASTNSAARSLTRPHR